MSGASPLVALFGEALADVFPDRSVPGGAPFNVARHLGLFGVQPLLITRIGEDALGAALLQEMTRLELDVSGFQRDPELPTGQVRVVLENGGHRFDILPDQAYDRVCADATRDILARHTPRIGYFGTLAQRSPASRRAAQAFVESVACPLFLDINLRPPWIDRDSLGASLAAADIVKLNDEELAAVAALFGLRETDGHALSARLMQAFELDQVLVTCGAEGSWLQQRDGAVLRAPAPPQALQIVDTVGAGDAYAAVFLIGSLMGWEPMVTLQRAGDYAAAICTVRGAVPPDRAFVERFSQAWSSTAAQ